jgi:hypothetical protein
MNRRAFLFACAGALALGASVFSDPALAAQKEPLTVTYYFLPG